MAILFSRIGAPSDGTTSIVLPYLDHIVVGEQLAIFVAHKNSGATVDVPAGWTQVATITGGTGSGVDAGTVRGTLLRRTADGTETGNVTLTFTGLSGTTGMGAVMAAYSGSIGGTWVFPGSVTVATTLAGTTLSAVASNPNVVAGDLLVGFVALNTDGATFTAEALSCTGVTFDTVNERFDLGTPKGEDEGLLIFDSPILAGPSTSNITLTATASAAGADAPKGGAIFFVLREVVPTAVITKSGQTRIIAGLTRAVMSAQDSYQSTVSPADAAMTGAKAVWDMGDGTTKSGLCVQHQWATAGTKTVTLTVQFKSGAISTTSTTYTVAAFPSTFTFDKYVASNGSDANPGTQTQPYLTMEKAFDAWRTFRGGSSTGFALGKISVRKGDTINFTNASQPHPDFGPLFITTYGASSTRPTISCSAAVDGIALALSSGGHDNLYDNPVFWKGIDFLFHANHTGTFPTDSATEITMAHVATQLEDSIVNGATVLMSITGGTTPHGSSLYNVEITDSWRNGVFFSSQFAVIENCHIHDNGSQDTRDNQIYASAGCLKSAVINTRLAQLANPTTSGGINCSGANKLYLADLEVEACRTAFGPGGNDSPLGEVTQDVVCERITGIDIDGVGFYANYLNRVSIRNATLFRCNGPAVRLQGYNASQKIQNLEILNSSFALCNDGISAEADGNGTDGQSVNVVIENVVISMPTSGTGITDHLFFMLKTAASIASFTLKNNQYYRVGDNSESVSFAQVGGYAGGATISYTNWQTNISHETGSHYGDPLFVDPDTNLALQAFSPCVDAGLDTGILEDILRVERPQGGDYDVGAYEHVPIAGLPAFPGAEGYGSDTIGGRGGVTLFVDNLNESGAGSLRAAVEDPRPRTIIFRVSGTITHTLATGALKIEHPFITIAGQTAPGEGITLKGEELRIQTHDVIIRYLRIRTGDKDPPHDNYDNRDVLNFGQPSDVTGTCQTYNIILDHISGSWSVDESFTTWYGAHHITYQYCLISEPLRYSQHPKTLLNGTPHSMGMLFGSNNPSAPSYCISVHHCVVLNSNQRNPQFSLCDRIDFRNNYWANWGSKTGSTLTAGAPMEIESPGRKRLNIVNNYYAEGPDSITPKHPTWIRVGADVRTSVDPGAEIYINGNYGPADGVMVTDPAYNNWLFLRTDGNDQVPESFGAHQYRLFAPFDCPPVTTMAAVDVPSILSEVGANRPYRDEIDARVILDAVNGTGHIIDTTDQVGGWLTMAPGTPFLDSDSDGIPDYWEDANGLDRNNPADALFVTLSGYTNLELFLNSDEPPPGTSVSITSSTMACGGATSPVIIPCQPGSGQISPFMRGLVYGHSTHDLPAANFEKWVDLAANFACWGNGEPLPYVDEEGITCGPHQGRVSTTRPGTTTAELTNWFFTEWFARFIPKQIAYNNLLPDDAHESKPLTNGTGEERRYYYSPAVRRAVYHPQASERQVGWDAAQTINKETIERRPFFHNSKNGEQGGPLPFTAKKGGPPEEINHNELDQFGNARSWNAVGNKSTFGADQWNAWDKQHNCGPNFHMAAAIGSRAGMVNLWNNWRWVITSFFPGSDGDSRGKQFDVPRSVGFGAFLAVYAYMAGFEWADPTMIKYHCGGNSNGDGTGQNGNAGWKPSHYFEWIVKSALGNAVADNGRVQLMPKGFIYWNIGCDNLGEPSCLCDCGSAPPPGPGTAGCNGAAWVGPDGVDYGSQTIGIDLWHAGIECSGLMLVDSLNDYVIKTWGPTRSLLTPGTASALKYLLSYASLEAIFRCIDGGTYATSHYYTGTAHSQSESPTTPRGYTQDVAQAMLDFMFICHPTKAVDCALRQINDGSGQWIVAEKVRNKRDLFYSLSMPWLMYTLGPNNPIVKKWLQAAAFIPLPGEEGSNQSTNYENHARFTDFAWALLENGAPVIITGSTMAAGTRLDGEQGHAVIISASTMAAGAGNGGNFKSGILLLGGIVKAGGGIAGNVGKGVIIGNAGIIAAAASFEGEFELSVTITASTMAAGVGVVTTPAAGGGPVVIAPPNRFRAGATMDFTGLRLGNAVVIVAHPLGAGAQITADTYVVWTESSMEAGAEMGGEPDAGSSFVILNPVMAAGGAAKGRSVVKHKHRFDASGGAIVLEG